MFDSFSGPLVSVAELQAQLSEPGATPCIVIDCRFALAEPTLGKQQYSEGHIPGAYYLSLDENLAGPVTAPLPAAGGRHPLPELGGLVETLNQVGLTAETMVVAYDSSRLAFASRLWWLLRYLGHDRVAVLDGGWQA